MPLRTSALSYKSMAESPQWPLLNQLFLTTHAAAGGGVYCYLPALIFEIHLINTSQDSAAVEFVLYFVWFMQLNKIFMEFFPDIYCWGPCQNMSGHIRAPNNAVSVMHPFDESANLSMNELRTFLYFHSSSHSISCRYIMQSNNSQAQRHC